MVAVAFTIRFIATLHWTGESHMAQPLEWTKEPALDPEALRRAGSAIELLGARIARHDEQASRLAQLLGRRLETIASAVK